MAQTRVRQSTLVQRSRRISPQDKATFHQVTGRVKRPFLGLTDDEIRAMTRRLDDGIRLRMRASS